MECTNDIHNPSSNQNLVLSSRSVALWIMNLFGHSTFHTLISVHIWTLMLNQNLKMQDHINRLIEGIFSIKNSHLLCFIYEHCGLSHHTHS